MTRYCDGCGRPHDLDAFDLDGDEAASVCRAHAHAREASLRRERQAKITALERQRRTLIASLVKIDAEIAVLRGTGSSPFERVDPSTVDRSDGFGD